MVVFDDDDDDGCAFGVVDELNTKHFIGMYCIIIIIKGTLCTVLETHDMI